MDKTWETISDIQNTLNYDDSDFSEIMKVSTRNFRTKRTKNSELNVLEAHRISNEFNISMLAIIKNAFCLDTVIQQKRGKVFAIPESYRECKHSMMFTVNNVLALADVYNFREDLLKQFQIHKVALDNETSKVSVQLCADLLDSISNKFSVEDIILQGARNALQLKDSEFGMTLRGCRSFVEVYEKWMSLEFLLETNWKYDIHIVNAKEVIITSWPHEYMMEHHKKKDYSNLFFTYFRIGVAAHLPAYIGLKPAMIEMIKSVHLGDNCCSVRLTCID